MNYVLAQRDGGTQLSSTNWPHVIVERSAAPLGPLFLRRETWGKTEGTNSSETFRSLFSSLFSWEVNAFRQFLLLCAQIEKALPFGTSATTKYISPHLNPTVT